MAREGLNTLTQMTSLQADRPKCPMPSERFLGDLLVSLYDAVESNCDAALMDEIHEDTGWAALVGTVAGIREQRDLERELNTHNQEPE